MEEILNKYMILGLREKLFLSQSQLLKRVGIGRRQLGKYESGYRKPNPKFKNKILRFIKSNNLSTKELEKIGRDNYHKVLNRAKARPLKLKYSKELAEFIGIILGDGEVKSDGTIRISFDPKKDQHYIHKRLKFLIKYLLNQEFYFESEKRIHFWNRNFVLFLEKKCNIEPGSKFEKHWRIPKWCFEDQKFLASVLRGLFDTDGYFAYSKYSQVTIMFGRFSSRSKDLAFDINSALDALGIDSSVNTCNDKRIRVRIFNVMGVLVFFNIIGSSGIRHIIRFLLWRTLKYPAKIEKEGLNNLIDKLGIDLSKIDLPFIWNTKYNSQFKRLIKKDEELLYSYQVRENLNSSKLIKDLTQKITINDIASTFKILPRSVRKWRQGTRKPSHFYMAKLLKLAKNNDLNVLKYGVSYGKGKDQSIGRRR